MKLAPLVLLLAAAVSVSASVSGQEVDLPNVDEMSMEELNELPQDIIGQLPARQMFRRVRQEAEHTGENELSMLTDAMVDLIIVYPLRELMYVNPIGRLEEQALVEAMRAFQSDLGHDPSGELTAAEFETLTRMAQRQRDTPVIALERMYVDVTEDYALATGTWIIEGDQIAYPINTSRISCARNENSCEVVQAEVDVPSLDENIDNYWLQLSTDSFQVISWSESEVIARGTAGLIGTVCRTTLLTIDGDSEEVYEITRNIGGEECEYDEDDFLSLPPLEAPRIARLVDGYELTREFWERRKEETNNYFNSALRESAFREELNLLFESQ
jgi:hypothetical protein